MLRPNSNVCLMLRRFRCKLKRRISLYNKQSAKMCYPLRQHIVPVSNSPLVTALYLQYRRPIESITLIISLFVDVKLRILRNAKALLPSRKTLVPSLIKDQKCQNQKLCPVCVYRMITNDSPHPLSTSVENSSPRMCKSNNGYTD